MIQFVFDKAKVGWHLAKGSSGPLSWVYNEFFQNKNIFMYHTFFRVESKCLKHCIIVKPKSKSESPVPTVP